MGDIWMLGDWLVCWEQLFYAGSHVVFIIVLAGAMSFGLHALMPGYSDGLHRQFEVAHIANISQCGL
jgi:hypothetical protein